MEPRTRKGYARVTLAFGLQHPYPDSDTGSLVIPTDIHEREVT